MKKYIIFITLLLIAMLASCSDELDKSANASYNQSLEKVGNIIIQPRNPNLPDIEPFAPLKQTKAVLSGEIGNSDAFLGRAYNLKNGNYILGDFSNVSHQIIDLNAVKAYDPNYVDGRKLNTTEKRSFTYDTFKRYQFNSSITKKITSGFSLDLKIFTLGKTKTTTEVFKTVIDNTEEATYGELNIDFVDSQFTLQNSDATRKLFARQFLTKSFIRSLYNSPISSTLNSYGDFVLTGYMTGGKAYAAFAGSSTGNEKTEVKEKDMDKSMNATLNLKKDTVNASANLGFVGKNHIDSTNTFKSNDTYVYIKTYGGVRDGSEATIGVRALKDLNVDLTSWMRSLNNTSNHTMIDVKDNSLYPLSDFVLEKNFKQRLDDTFNEVLPNYNNLVRPYIEIIRVMARPTSSYEVLYDVAAVLVTRQADRIILSDGLAATATDEELRKNENDAVFMQKVEKIAAEKSKFFSSDIEISYNSSKRLNPNLRTQLCINLKGFNEKNFYKFFYEKTSIQYIYDPTTRICFSYFVDEGDDEVLDIYGIRNWVESLPEKNISIASLANSYNIIGL